MLSYHLWVMPSGAAYDVLAKTIEGLSDRYHAPRFPPHVTLLGQLPGSEAQILACAAMLAGRLRPYDIRLTAPGMTEQYFQCLFLQVEPTEAVRNAHAHAVSIFSADPAPYSPHLSLMYGRFPAPLKQQIASALPSSLFLQFTVDRLEIIRASSEDPGEWDIIRAIRFGPPKV
jgi:2'-5' RNA ligase